MFGFKLFRKSEVEAKDAEITKLKESGQVLTGRLQELGEMKNYLRDLCETLVNHTITEPDKLGIAFANSSDSNFAAFLNSAGAEMRSWDHPHMGIMQAYYIKDKLDKDGLWLLNEIFEVATSGVGE